MRLKTEERVVITHDKKGNIKKIETPYDENETLNNPINSVAEDNHNTLLNVFKGFGEAFALNYQR